MVYEKTVSLLTLNTWGLKYVSKRRKERLRAIAERLSRGEYDVVALQEIWVEEDWAYLEEACRSVYPYRRRFLSGILTGPGLALLLKLPVERTFLYRFPINGRPSAFFRGDWFVGKSVAITLLHPRTGAASADGAAKTPAAAPLAVLNSHMHAPYAQTGDAAYAAHRACQAWDLAQLVRTLKRAGYAVVQVGDLNLKPGSLPHKLFTAEAGLMDSWEAVHGVVPPDELAALPAPEQIVRGGVTCDLRLNTWRSMRAPWEACRLDYALVDAHRVRPVLAAVRFTEPLPPPLSCSCLDHFGYSFEFVQQAPANFGADDDDPALVAARLEAYRELLAEIRRYLTYTIPFQAGWRRAHFFVSVLLVVVINVGISFASNVRAWASVLLSVASTLIGITGVVNGMIWFFAVRSELRALNEVRMEVEDAQAALKQRLAYMDIEIEDQGLGRQAAGVPFED